MPRLSPLPLDAVPDLGPLFQEAKTLMGFTPNDGLTLARRPDIALALMGLVRAIYAPGELDNGTKRLVGEATSKAAGCTYCAAHAANSAKAFGVPEAKIAAVWSFEDSDLFTEAERAAIRVGMRAGYSPNAVTDEDFDELKAHYSDEQIVELVSVIALFGFLNRWNATLATELEAMPASLAKALEAKHGDSA